MQTLTIRVDDSYVEQVLNFLQKIPKNKREIFQHKKIDTDSIDFAKKERSFLDFLEKGPTISEEEGELWEKNIEEGYKSWAVEEF